MAQQTPLKVGIYQNPPKIYFDDSGQAHGFYPAVLDHIAKEEGWALQYVPCAWAACLKMVEEGTIDLMPDVAYSAERAKRFDFSEETVLSDWSRVYAKDPESIRSILDLDGKRVAVLEGSIQARNFALDAQAYAIRPVPVPADTFEDAFDLVERGRADAVIASRLFASRHLETTSLRETGVVLYPFRILFAAPKDRSGALLAAVDTRIRALKADPKSIYHLALTQAFSAVAQKTDLRLTAAERAWLASHREIRVGVMKAWPPMDYVDSLGRPRGIGADMINALNQHLGGVLKIEPGSWQEIYEKAKNGELDVLSGITPRPDREAFFNFTTPYVTVPHVIFARDGAPAYAGLADLAGKTVGIERGFFLVDVLARKYPQVRVREYESTSNALDALSRGEVDAYVGNRAVALYTMQEGLISNVRAQARIEETASVNAFGVRKDWPILRDILQKALDGISVKERKAILGNWVDAGAAMERARLTLTADEKAWIAEHPVIRIAVAEDRRPFESIDSDGSYRGLTADYLDAVRKRTGLRFEVVPVPTRIRAVEELRRGLADMAPALIPVTERKEFLAFTQPYLTYPQVIVVRKGQESGADPEALDGKTMAVAKGDVEIDDIKRFFPKVELLVVEDPTEKFRALADGRAQLVSENLAIVKYILNRHDISELTIAGRSPLPEERRSIGVRRDWPELATILDKALDSLTPAEHQEIRARWGALSDNLWGEAVTVDLTPEERAFLRTHEPIRMGTDPLRAPIDFVGPKGDYQGIASDYVDLLETRLGVEIDFVPTDSLTETLDQLDGGKIDLVSTLSNTSPQSDKISFTAPFVEFPIVILTRDDAPFVEGLESLNGRNVAVVRDYSAHHYLARNHASIKLVAVDTVEDGLKALASRRAFAFVEDLATSSFGMQRAGISGLKVAAPTPYANKQVFGVRSDLSRLARIVEKGLASISRAERSRIHNKWVSIKQESVIDYSLVWRVAAGFCVVLLVVAVWNRQINRQRAALRRSEGRMRSVIDTAADGVIVIDAQGIIETFSPAAQSIFGYASDEVIGRNIKVLMPEPYRGEHDRYLGNYLESGEAKVIGYGREVEGLRKDGTRFPMDLAIGEAAIDGEWMFTGIVRDITERKQRQRELAEKELNLRLAMENMSDGIYTLDDQGRYRMFNQRYVDLIDAPLDMVAVGKPIRDVFLFAASEGYFGPGDPEQLAAQRLERYLSPGFMESEVVTPGHILSVRKMSTSDGGAVVVLGDITTRRKAERDLFDAFSIISDSIAYASRIQRSMLPQDHYLTESLSDHFVIWEPRDRVGGDIYWYRTCGDGFLVGLADCTGHGVPGAFMSLIATGSLDRAMRERPDGDPAAVLHILNRSIKRYLGQDSGISGGDDGMDVGICRLRPGAGELVFAGARFSLFVADSTGVSEVKGDRASVGYRAVSPDQVYTNKVVEMLPGASFYLTTDGLTDQVGGASGRMFGKRRFMDLLRSIQGLPMADQKDAVLQALSAFQGQENRRDDVSVVGFRL
ncbi:MAG: transporter substrate-binding domain-containing protein [Hyphomicrobiales bacterium]|nr:transporter substrate-binding domain-containing protein [Hyphomicrobiales bacterium]MCP5371285.1 transporter substrate-binding domain-containing protein [Hyphomicrobiales bacterium]